MTKQLRAFRIIRVTAEGRHEWSLDATSIWAIQQALRLKFGNSIELVLDPTAETVYIFNTNLAG